MSRSLRQSRFRRSGDLSEDVNPSAYIVNLADCMLVLACGFMVAMISFWNIDLVNVEQLQADQLEQVNPETLPEDMQSGGSYYVEAGTVYMDPNTGDLWMVTEENAAGGEAGGEGSAESSSVAAGSGGSSSASSTGGDSGSGSTGSGSAASGGSSTGSTGSTGSGGTGVSSPSRAMGAD